jgi:hypothetical protein
VEVAQSYVTDNGGNVGGKNGGNVTNLSQALLQVKEKVASLKKKISAEEMAIYILDYCSTWRSMDEIARFANRDKNYIRNKVLPRLAEELEKEYPDVPNHPRQRYKTVAMA